MSPPYTIGTCQMTYTYEGLITLKVQIFASSNFGENKFLRELIFAILGIFAKFAKFSSRKICQIMHFREIRENKFPQNI